MKQLLIIAGPTASGKTALAIAVAKKLGAEIISADARQFYREMSIGTAVPTQEELAAVPHHFIRHKSIFEKYDVGRYEVEVIKFLDEYFTQKDIAVLCGGSGLYIRAVCQGLDKFPDVADEIINQVQMEYQTFGMEYLQQKLLELDPVYFSTVDKENPHRLMRAITVSMQAGKPFSSFRSNASQLRNFTIKKYILDLPREELYARINTRVDQMMANGLEAEARGLFEYRNLTALQTVGYTELFDYFENKISKETAIELIKQHTRNYAKRQLTWFRKEPDCHWLQPSQADKIFDEVAKGAIH